MSASIPFDRAAHFYDSTRGFPPGIAEQAVSTIVEAGGLDGSSHLLEIGIGTGRIALPLARYVRQIDGVDLSLPMLERLRSKRAGEAVRVVRGDIMTLPFSAAAFDAVVAVHIFHLVGSPQRALAEAARVLKPGGLLIHAFGSGTHQFRLHDVWADISGRFAGADGSTPWAKRTTVAEDHGWRLVRERTFDYRHAHTPRQYIQQVRDRCWSNTWGMSDEALAEGIRRLEAHVSAHYADPDAVEDVPARFVARAYQPA
jgi:ubiquinone/menaquinone biosynthesis C-methylase UbiE